MKRLAQIGRWRAIVGLVLAIVAMPVFAQNRRNEHRNAPRPNQAQPSRSQDRPQTRHNESQSRPQSPSRPQIQAEPRPYQPPPPYQPPSEGHHSGQWLNQHREEPLDQQRRALQSDPRFRQLPRERQQKLEQRLQHFDNLPQDRQQQVLRRMETWEHLTSQQKQQFRSFDSQYRNLPPDRRQAVKNALDTLRAMPPDARRREIQSGRFSQFSPQEREVLNGASQLPLAPTPQPPPSNTGPQRYIPRPPR